MQQYYDKIPNFILATLYIMIVNDSHVLFMHALLPLNLNMGNITHFCFIKCSELKHSIVFLLLLAQFFKAIPEKYMSPT